MATSDPVRVWTVVKVPYPYTDRPVWQRRPALVVAATGQRSGVQLLWVLMITSAENRGWAGDVAISDLQAAGLPAASVVRPAKIATIDAAEVAPPGLLPDADRAAVRAQLRRVLDGALRHRP
ncbi:MAG: type II toxin-antitoxin system PemK/MazF family toxin [Alphaproteobacteria bacterium]|nr:type II toxin-antitoxin system PemK/MazF family toxin [Alphaproteobacteria bacterium]